MQVKTHWNYLADTFEDEVGNPLFEDRNSTISNKIKECSDQSSTAIDFGCGIGAALPLLSSLFSSVVAMDISDRCIRRAKSIPGLHNVTFLQKDLTRPVYTLSHAYLGYCCNVVLFPDTAKNKMIFANVMRAVRPGGYAIFIVPSIESAILSSMRLVSWYDKEQTDYSEIDRSEFEEFNSKSTIPHLGILKRAGVLTKHYVREEIELQLTHKGMSIESITKVEYNWSTEFAKPPKWMKVPYPWDWMIHCKKK